MNFKRLLFLLLSMSLFSCCQAETTNSDVMKVLKKGENIQISNQIIKEDVDFTKIGKPVLAGTKLAQVIVENNIIFVNCVFLGNILTNGTSEGISVNTKFMKNVIFYNCDFRGVVNFDNSNVLGKLDFQKSKFRQTASFNNLYVVSKNTYFSEIEAEKNFSMIYSSFLGNLFFINARFDENLSMQESVINENLSCNNMKCLQQADLSMISVRGRAMFNYTEFNDVNFSLAKFYDKAEFNSMNVKGKYDFEKSSFGNEINICDTINLEKAYILKH